MVKPNKYAADVCADSLSGEGKCELASWDMKVSEGVSFRALETEKDVDCATEREALNLA